MRLHVPTIGDCLRLTADWTFTLWNERRNWAFINVMGLPHVRELRHTLPAGTVLKVGRVYIRGNQRDFDSITFRVVGTKKARFWVKLDDANTIEFDHVEQPVR
jgi:hypothetical protein